MLACLQRPGQSLVAAKLEAFQIAAISALTSALLSALLQEDAMLLDGHRRHGNKWTLIAQEIGGRTDNAVKNRWAALEKKRKADEEPTDLVRRHAPMLRPQNDLLGVRRVICKDQPRYRDPLMGSGPVDEALWAQEMREDDQQLQQFQPLQQQQQQLPYAISSSFMVQQPMQQTGEMGRRS